MNHQPFTPPIIHDGAELHRVAQTLDAPVIALFLAFRDPESKWASSIPRRTLNEWDPRLAFLCCQIPPEKLAAFYLEAALLPRNMAMNHTAPLKDRPALWDFLQLSRTGDERVLDVCFRNSDASPAFVGTELNGPTFVDWLSRAEPPEQLRRSTFVIYGNGGAGSAIARALRKAGFVTVITVERDPDKPADFRTLADVPTHPTNPVVLVDATGDASLRATQALDGFFRRPVGPSVFVDLRTATHSPQSAPKELTQWTSHDGSAWSFANDWAFYCRTMQLAGLKPKGTEAQFAEFSAGVVAEINAGKDPVRER